MKKSLVLTGTIALLVSMIGASFVGNTGLELIMSDAPLHNAIRSVIILGLLVLAFTMRPRARSLRIGLGVVSAGITIIALAQTFNYSLQILDALIYLAAATAFMNEALEGEPVVDSARPIKKLGTA